MSKPKPIRERMQEIIDERRKQLTKEVELYERKMRDTARYYGIGGPYSRQERAKEERERQLKELEEFGEQLRRVKKTQKLRVYAFGCGNCGCACMTTIEPFDSWHECPTCRRMIHLNNLKSMTLEVTEDCKAGEWLKRIVWDNEERVEE